MPIRVNLLAEALAAEDMRRRDPVKRAVFFGALVVALVLVWSSSLMLENMLAKRDLSQVQAEIESHTNEYAVVTASLKKIADAQGKLQALQNLSNARFLQGNLLNTLQQTYVQNVVLTRMHLDQQFVYKEGVAAKKTSSGTTPLQPPTTTEKTTVVIDAKDFSSNPGDQVNKFKDAIAQQPLFQTNLDKTNGVRLASLSPPQAGLDGKPYVLFTIECRFNDHQR